MTTPALIIAVPNAPTIDLSNLTQGIATGVGVFDVLMRGVISQLESLLNKDQISKNEFANMVLQAIPSVMQQSTAYALAKEKQGYEIAILEQQYELAVKQVEVQIKQSLLLDKEVSLKDKEIALSQAQRESQDAQTLLYMQKTATEKAQINPTDVQVGSVIYLQNQVLIKQKEAFDHDARLKLVKVYADTWIVRRNADDLTAANHINFLNDRNLGNVIEAASVPLGITPDDTPEVPVTP